MPHSYDAAFLKSLQHQTQKYSDRLDKCVQDLEEHSGDSAVSVTEVMVQSDPCLISALLHVRSCLRIAANSQYYRPDRSA